MPLGILGGTLIASALQALFGIGSTMAANKYNSPTAQLKRLRKAGLPLSYMYKGNVATQSEVPKLSIDPTLGTLAKQQGAQSKAVTRKTTSEAENTELENQIKDLMSGIKQPDGTEWNNRGTMMMAEMADKRATAFLHENQASIENIARQVEQSAFNEGIPQEMKKQALEKAKNQVINLLEQKGLMQQLQKIRGFEALLNDSLTNNIADLPDWLQALAKIILIASKR